jgi:ribonuclease HI
MGLGPGSNNYAEFLTLKLLLLFAKEKQVSSLQIFGDSMLVISWIRKTQRCHNLLLSPLLDEIFRILATFDSFSI